MRRQTLKLFPRFIVFICCLMMSFSFLTFYGKKTSAEEPFKFMEVADYLLTAGKKTPETPEKPEIVIESFETAG